MARRLRTVDLAYYLLTPPDEVDEERWWHEVRETAFHDVLQQLEALMDAMGRGNRDARLPHWGCEVEQEMVAALWTLTHREHTSGQYASLLNRLRRLGRLVHPS